MAARGRGLVAARLHHSHQIVRRHCVITSSSTKLCASVASARNDWWTPRLATLSLYLEVTMSRFQVRSHLGRAKEREPVEGLYGSCKPVAKGYVPYKAYVKILLGTFLL